VNIVSMGSLTGLAKKTAYLSTKWAMRGMTQCAAAELGQYGIRVNAVHPGGVATDMTAGQSLDTYVVQPIPRMGLPTEIAQAALFLASDDSSYCTGAEIVVDGGRLAGAVQVPDVKAQA
jgi:3alpha(or 20beta)-hydroxysteroid dehydrogenase